MDVSGIKNYNQNQKTNFGMRLGSAPDLSRCEKAIIGMLSRALSPNAKFSIHIGGDKNILMVGAESGENFVCKNTTRRPSVITIFQTVRELAKTLRIQL